MTELEELVEAGDWDALDDIFGVGGSASPDPEEWEPSDLSDRYFDDDDDQPF